MVTKKVYKKYIGNLMLSGKGIEKSFNTNKVLDKIDIEVLPGKISVLIGPSGSGKTTLIRALSLIDMPNTGQIKIDADEYSFPLKTNRNFKTPWPKVTVVFQQHFLWPHLTLRDNILLPLKNKSDTNLTVNELIDIFDMKDFIDRFPNEVSLGQRQRAALARAFALHPKYILLDEITSALDVEQTATVVKHLLSLRDKGIGMLVVTHLLTFARDLVSRDEGDKIYLLDQSKIVSSGGVNFFTNPKDGRTKEFLASINYWSNT